MNQNTQAGRLYALDALRGHMMLLGIVLHAGLCYGAAPIDAIWPLRDASATLPIAALVSLITTFRMPVFFLVAGFFFQMMINRNGPGSAITDRLRRVIIPLLVFLPVVILSCGAAFDWSVSQLPPGNPVREEFTWFKLYHLWFLYFLLLYYLVFGLVALISHRTEISPALLHGIPFWMAPLLWGCTLGGLAQLSAPFKLESSLGVIPDPVRFAFFALFFSFGQWLHLKKAELASASRLVWFFLAMTVTCAVTGVASAVLFDRTPETLSGLETGLLGSALFFLCMLIVASYMRWSGSAGPIKTYLSKASFWIYLFHMPVVLWLFVLLDGFSLNIYLKFLINITATTFICLLSYHLFVRGKWIGAMLDGKKFIHLPSGRIKGSPMPNI